jgi:hypothetical protein
MTYVKDTYDGFFIIKVLAPTTLSKKAMIVQNHKRKRKKFKTINK